MRLRRHAVALVLLAVLAVGVSGCASSSVEFVDSGTAYTAQTVTAAVDSTDKPAAWGRPVSDAEELRHEALVDLRAMEGQAAEVADLLTTQFPEPARSVPYYVEAATFEETPAWVIVEVWGSDGGSLDQTRVWVFDSETDEVLFTAAIS